MESTQLEKYIIELKAMRDRLATLEQEFAEDSDDDLRGDVHEFLHGARENLSDALGVLKNK